MSNSTYVITTEKGFTKSLDGSVVHTLLSLGLIEFEGARHVMQDGRGNGVGPVYKFYRGVGA